MPFLLYLRRLRLPPAFLWELGRPRAIKAYPVFLATLQNVSMSRFDGCAIQKLPYGLRCLCWLRLGLLDLGAFRGFDSLPLGLGAFLGRNIGIKPFQGKILSAVISADL